ncbi:hypothetical protein QBC37DRAFT_400336 [Rhypophila decipiens]|uniref:Uncharacterized protein n=1 Tax=Rhypophila decipiens TaxID=261697 RepID=A0AAN7B7Z5_9PEZI|nr:hypothetical protein QBC37DRAFT_400336 [Rhypophila decipiens]
MFTISAGNAKGGSVEYIVGEKLEIGGGNVTAPKANVSHLVYIRWVTETRTVTIGGAFATGAEMKINDTDTSPKVKADNATGGKIRFTEEGFDLTGGTTEGMDANSETLREIAKFTGVKKVVVTEAKAQGAVISGIDDGEGTANGTYERKGNYEQEGNDSDTLYEQEAN